jgi:crossover junction endodeoxyribonuclease RuvC
VNPPVVIGIDPGISGAVAAVDAATGGLVWVEDMPALDKHVNAAALADLLEGEVIVAAAVEAVHAMPKQGVSSSFNFGRSYGVVLGVLAALNTPVVHLRPAQWKKALGLSADKSASRRMATDLWPAQAEQFKRVKDDGRAEAALIARHAWATTSKEAA